MLSTATTGRGYTNLVERGHRRKRSGEGAATAWLVYRFLIYSGLIAAVFSPIGAQAVSLGAADSGWYDNLGSHTPSNQNFIAGACCGPSDHRNFFVFDLSSVTSPVATATLRLEMPLFGYGSPDPTEDYVLYEISTDIATLTAGGSGLLSIFDDLSDGPSFGSISISPADNNTIVEIALNATALGAINAALGGTFALGGSLTTLSGFFANEFVFGTTDGTFLRELVLTVCNVDGVVDPGEPCDDGNVANGDGCSSSCGIEDCWSCTGSPSSCSPLGAGAACTDDGNLCTDDQCDGAGTCEHPNNTAPCDDSVFCNGTDTCSGGSCSIHTGDPCPGPDGDGDCAESCDEANDICASPDPAGSACASDGNVCTDDVCDGAGSCGVNNADPCDDSNACTDPDTCNGGTCSGTPLTCDDGDICTQDSCDTGTGCVFDAAPVMDCKAAEKSILVLKNNADDNKDKLLFKWLKGEETTLGELGTPTGTTSYTLCLYAGTTSASVAMEGGSKWQPLGTKGFKYKDTTTLEPDGAKIAKLKSGDAGKAKVLVKGKGDNLPDDLAPELPLPVTAQLVNDENATCFEAIYDTNEVIKNNEKLFKAKAQQ